MQDLFSHWGEGICHGTKMGKHGQRECHKKKALLYVARKPISIFDQVQGCSTVESRKKRIQFASLFVILCSSRPMLEFSDRYDLYKFFEMPNCPKMHWSPGSGWSMAEHIYDFIKKKQTSLIQATSFISISCDETTAVDNTSVIVVHAYVMSNWSCQRLMIGLLKMESDGATSNSLTKLLMGALIVNCNLDEAAISSKLLCFGVDRVAVFQ